MVNIAPVRDESGEVLWLVAILRDITRLKELDRVKSQFVSMVSHELRAPLAAIQGYLEVLLSNLAGNHPERVRKMMQRACERTQALLRMVDDLLQLSHIEAGKIRRNLRPVAAGEVAREVVLFFQEEAVRRSIALHEDIPEKLPPIIADREEIARLLNNLASNALKSNRPGGSATVRARSGVLPGEAARNP